MIIRHGKTYYNAYELSDLMHVRPSVIYRMYYDAIDSGELDRLGDYFYFQTCGGRVDHFYMEHDSAERFTGRKIYDWYADFYDWRPIYSYEHV